MLIYYHIVLLALFWRILWVRSCYNSKTNKQTQNSYMKVLQVLEVPIFDFGYFVVLQVKQRSVRGKIFWHFFQTLCDSKRNNAVSKRDAGPQNHKGCAHKKINVAMKVLPLSYFSSSRNYIDYNLKYLLYSFQRSQMLYVFFKIIHWPHYFSHVITLLCKTKIHIL